jgi:hypothetical protein
LDQPAAQAKATQAGMHKQKAQLSPLIRQLNDKHRTDGNVILADEPKPRPSRVGVEDEIGSDPGAIRLMCRAETVVDGVLYAVDPDKLDRNWWRRCRPAWTSRSGKGWYGLRIIRIVYTPWEPYVFDPQSV